MSRTGHSSTDGVRAYKRTSNKLKEQTSDVLNCKTVSTVEEQEPKSKRVCLKQEDPQENFMPTILYLLLVELLTSSSSLLWYFLLFKKL